MRIMLALLLAGIVLGGTVDLVLDAPADWLTAHVASEILLIVGALAASIRLWLGWRRAAESAARQALDGLGSAVHDQFVGWGLTPAEREVALGLLQGPGHKQIAAATGRSEQTVRQHSVAVYRKGRPRRARGAGRLLSGRSPAAAAGGG
jgi:hypothetical protein